MRRIPLLLLLSSAPLALLQAQPTITSLQSGFSAASGPQFGAAITSGTALQSFTLFINGSFTPNAFSAVEWTNTVTNVTAIFAVGSGVVSNSATQIVVNVPAQIKAGSLFASLVASPQTVNIIVFEQSPAPPSNPAPFTVNPPLAPPSPTVLPAGTAGQPYNTTIFSGGTAPYSVSFAESSLGTLPPGLNFQNSPTLSGTPTQPGLFQYDVQIVDEWGNYIIVTETIGIFGVPTISSIVPNSAIAGNNSLAITVTGTNFAIPVSGAYPGTTIALLGGGSGTFGDGGGFPIQVSLATNVVNATTATATIPAALLTAAGQLPLVAIQPGNAQSNAVPFAVLGPAITGVSPSSVTARSTQLLVTVTGSGFLASGSAAPAQSTILVNGSPATTTFASPTGLTTNVVLSTPGVIPIQVENPGGALSNSVSVTVLPAPTITSVTPSPFPGGKLSVNGANFTATMTVLFNGAPLSTSFVNAGQLTVTVTSISGSTALVSVMTADNYITPATRITLGTPLQITSSLLPNATGLQPYDFKLAATGGTQPYSWVASGLPSGLSINPATGEITGTPTAFGDVGVLVTVTDVNRLTAVAGYSLIISAPAPAPQINSATLPNGFVNVSYSYTFTATGGNGNLIIGPGTGTVPPGLTLDNGVIRGVPTTAGSYTFSVVVTDADGLSGNGSFTLVIKPQPLAISTPGPLASVNAGATVSIKFAAFGGVPPYTFTATGNLPPGTSIAADGTLSGTATTPGTYPFTVVVNDSAQDTPGTKSFSITVNGLPLTVTATLGNGQVGVAYSGQIGATGGVSPYSITVSGLPDGLSFANGAVSGTPTTAGQYTVSVNVTDSAKTTAAQSFPVTISAAPLAITTASLPNGTMNVVYSASLSASGGSGKYSWVVTGLPAGVTATSAGAISGTPTAAGAFSVVATVTDTAVVTAVVSASKTFSVTIAPAPLSVSTTSLANATAGTPYSATVAATGGVPPYSWTATGLPAGLSISSGGAISGTPTAAGSATVVVTVKDSSGTTGSSGTTASRSLPLTVALPPTPPVSLTGLPSTSPPATQSTLTIGIGAPYPVAVTVNLTLTFTATSGPDDPTVQFSTGGRTAQLTIPAGSTTASSTVGVQTGTVAGTATITTQLLAGTQDITPIPAPTSTVRIPSVAPVVTSVTATSTSGGFTVTMIGYATSRSMTQAVFTFTPSSGVNLQTTSVTIPAASLFSTWYSSSAALPFGSQFSFTQAFTVTGGTAAVASVSVTLTNSDGTSTPVSAAVH